MNYRIRKRMALLGMTALATVSVAGCASGSTKNNSTEKTSPTEVSTSSTSTSTVSTAKLSAEDMFTARDKEVGYDEATSTSIKLADSGCSSSSDSVTVDGHTVTITEEGTYILSGSLNNGQIQVNAMDAKVQLVLNGVEIHNSSSAAIYVVDADKVFVTLAEGSENTVSTDGEFSAIDDNNIDGAIFAKDDLTINGNGTLNVRCDTAHGIVCKNDLCITTGTYNITAASHAIAGKNSVRIADGVFTLTSGKDAIHSENIDDTEKGFVYISDGTFTMTSTTDGIDASNVAQIEGGTFQITSSEAKGIKGDAALFLMDGTVTITSKDDGFHTKGDLEMNAGTYSVTTEDDGMHAGNDLVINDGTLHIPSCNEGIEATTITINQGTIDCVSKDDGFNASAGSTSEESGTTDSQNTRSGGKSFESDASCALTINGGTIKVNAQGDGIDSNGSILITGGEIYVDGPTNSGNGSIDTGSGATITGGTVIAVGSSGMAENFTTDSTQCAMLVNLSETLSDKVVLKDSKGKEIISYEPAKTYNSVVISTPDIKTGETYTLSCGNTDTSVEMTSTIYGESNGMGGGHGMGGGRDGSFKKGNRSDNFQGGNTEMPSGDMGTPPTGAPETRKKPNADNMPQAPAEGGNPESSGNSSPDGSI